MKMLKRARRVFAGALLSTGMVLALAGCHPHHHDHYPPPPPCDVNHPCPHPQDGAPCDATHPCPH